MICILYYRNTGTSGSSIIIINQSMFCLSSVLSWHWLAKIYVECEKEEGERRWEMSGVGVRVGRVGWTLLIYSACFENPWNENELNWDKVSFNLMFISDFKTEWSYILLVCSSCSRLVVYRLVSERCVIHISRSTSSVDTGTWWCESDIASATKKGVKCISGSDIQTI